MHVMGKIKRHVLQQSREMPLTYFTTRPHRPA
jgi:hypothetical protein